MEAAGNRLRDNRSRVELWLRQGAGDTLVEALVRPRLIEAGLISLHDLAEVALVEDEVEVARKWHSP